MKSIFIGVVLIWITILPSNKTEKIRESEDIWKQSPLEYDEQCVKWCTNNKKTKGLFARPHQYNSPIHMSNQRINDLRADKKTELFPPEFFEEFYEKIKQDGQFIAQKSQIDNTVQDHQQLPNREYLEHIFEDNIGHPLKKHTNFEKKLQSKISGKGSANPVSQEEPMDSMEGEQLIINQDNIMEGPSAGYLGNNMQGLFKGYPGNGMQGPSVRYPSNNIQEPFQGYPGYYMEGPPKVYLARSHSISQEEAVEPIEEKLLFVDKSNIMEEPSVGYLGNNLQGYPGRYSGNIMHGLHGSYVGNYMPKNLQLKQGNITQGLSGGYPGNNIQGFSQGYPGYNMQRPPQVYYMQRPPLPNQGNNMHGPPQGYPGNNMQESLQSNQGNIMEGSNKNRPARPLQLPKFPSLSSFPSIMKPQPMCPIGCMPVPFFQPPKFPFIG